MGIWARLRPPELLELDGLLVFQSKAYSSQTDHLITGLPLRKSKSSITKTCNIYPPEPGVCRGISITLIFAPKHLF